jgi:hypothetical protein
MSTEPPEGELSAELRELGRNLKAAAKTAWESEESRRLQQELRNGMAALEASLREATSDETRARVRTEVHQMGERLRSGEVEGRVRGDLLSALRSVNAELKKASRSADDSSGKA